MQDRLGCGHHPPLLGKQPRLEGRRPLDRHTFKQLRPKPGQADGIGPRAPDHHRDVYHRTGREPENHRIAADRPVVA